MNALANTNQLIIYLIDPVHNYISSRDIWTIPLNILTIGSYIKAAFNDKINVKMFKFPDEFFKAINNESPNIVAVSNYIWNYELSTYLLRYSKKIDPKIVTAMGGPNVNQTQEWMSSFLRDSYCDFYISGSGEYPFKCLVDCVINNRKPIENDGIQGCWQLDGHTKNAFYTPTRYTIEDLDDIPSPFKNTMVDEFFQKGLMPMIETLRGCPFRCTYCNWGDATQKKIHTYSIKRVKEDIDYCRNYSKDERLMIDDANFGLFADRDLVIAKYIKELRTEYNWPGKLILTWGQSKSDTGLQIAKTLKDLCMMTQSSQSMDSEVLKNIKRHNITKNDWKKTLDYCKKHKIETYAELMVPLPGETLSSYINAVRFFFEQGVDFINTNPLMLLKGAEMNTVHERNKFKMKTKWRLLENCYGIYDKHPVIEYQEMVVETNTFSYDDYLFCRILSWLIQMSWNLKRHDLIFRLVHLMGINPVDFFTYIIQNAFGIVKDVFDSFLKDAKDELFDTKEDLMLNYSSPNQMEFLKNGGFRKLNTHYSSLVSIQYHNEFIDYYESIAHKLIEDFKIKKDCKDLIHECRIFMEERFLTNIDLENIEQGKIINKKIRLRYDFLNMAKLDKEYFCKNNQSENILYHFYIEEEQKSGLLTHLKSFSGMTREYQLRKLQEPYHGIHKKHLLFNVKQI